MESLKKARSRRLFLSEKVEAARADSVRDQTSMRNALQATQMMGANRLEMAYIQRMVSPQLSPDRIVAQLFPQISGGAMQNVRILGKRRLPYGATAV